MPTTSEFCTGPTGLYPSGTTSELEDRASGDRAAAPIRVLPAGAASSHVFQPVASPKLLELVELILKDRSRLDGIIRDPALAAELVPRFLAVSLIGFSLFGVALSLVIHSVGVRLELQSIKSVLEGIAPTLIEFTPLGTSPGIAIAGDMYAGLKLTAAYDLGLIAAAGVCLPSLYFYGLLAGIPLSMARVTVHTVKAMATTAVALVGILPIYVAFSLGAAIFQAPRVVIDSVLWLGLVLPFGAGLFGVNSLYAGFTALADALPLERRYRRTCFLRRLVVSWSVCYTAVTPVMIYTLWEFFTRTS